MTRRTHAEIARQAVADERRKVTDFFDAQRRDVEVLVERGAMDADSASLLCIRLSTIAEQISIGLHEDEGILS